MRSTAFEGGGFVLLEFQAGFNPAKALADVRDKVDDAKRDLPRDADEPAVSEVNLSLFPVLSWPLTGDVPERSCCASPAAPRTHRADARRAVGGAAGRARRGVEVIAEPMLLKSYGISLQEADRRDDAGQHARGGRRAGGRQRPFRREGPRPHRAAGGLLKLPIAATAGASVALGDVAEVRPTFKDATSITRVNGKPAIAIEVSKRTGANLIQTVDM